MVKINKQQLIYESYFKYGLMLFGVGLFIVVISYFLPYTQMPIIAWIKKNKKNKKVK